MKKGVVLSLIAASLMLVGCSGKKEEQKSEAVAHQTEQKAETKKAESVQQTQKSEPVKRDVASAVHQEQAPQTSASAQELFNKCASCHGPDGKRKALGKSGIIAGMSKDEVLKKLKEYEAGTLNKYGMGPLMKAQVAGLSDKELEALAEYIASMK
ncbi:c-type cytochrome [Nitratiruptor sp. SB155-2]|uniref:c-type cytochrome n=1 Tax=Nitratiruptor sp. (strain SB155-2) TaxID=387092 RepID=UPI000158728D|nr:c-type cytochrome [Nitratiruptor sp. SB155-2]BAF70686.1 conserved hypothetical protein [Nitratiruptor sp. SB155-2]